MTRIQTLLVSFLAVGALAACSKSDGENKQPAEPAKPPSQPAAADKPPAPAPSFDEAFASYESIRVALAADKTDGVAEAATKLAKLAADASNSAPDNLKAHYTGIAKAAGDLAKAEDVAAMRGGFGDVSREVVGLMEMSPGTAKGQHVFECPMAKGYKRWIQPSAELANPYMGTEMLGCGSEVALGKHDMKGMDHGTMKGMETGDMKGMDHGDMKGVE